MISSRSANLLESPGPIAVPGRSRRCFLSTGSALAAGTLLGGCAQSSERYEDVERALRAPLSERADSVELVRYATLAANGHNTQPWRFELRDPGIHVVPDFSRRTPVVDPDDHHLYASLGCAAENLSLAARARGLSGEVAFEPAGDGRILVNLETGGAVEGDAALVEAIPKRQVSRAVYDGRSLDGDVIGRLRGAANVHGVEAILVTEPRTREALLELIVSGNTRQLDDPAFVAELERWIRFNPREAAEARDGLFAGCAGNPSLPSWIAPAVFGLVLTTKGENRKCIEQARSSSGLMVFVAATDDPAGWVAAGRACQRFALQATADGVAHAYLNQCVEVPEMRAELRSLLGIGERRPNLVVRFGRGPEMPRSLRRPASDVLAVA